MTCDAVFSLTAYDFEPVSVDAFKSWIAEEWNKEVYAVGPLLASKPTTYGIASDSTIISSEVETFLDKSLKEYGEKSLVLVSSNNRLIAGVPDHHLALRSRSGRYFGRQCWNTLKKSSKH